MADVLYALIIYPIRDLIELCYLFTMRVFDNPSLALFGISAAVSIGTLPLYFVAEKWQILERETQKKLKPEIENIKRCFKGDERFMILSTYYRQNHYHPIYALRSSFGLMIQIPFFMAAYGFLSHLEALQGAPFLFVRDLGAPDALLTLGALQVNILPIVMTLLNCVAGAIYTRGFEAREKVQVYGMAAIFLVLLYNSPAGLVIYWTANQVFSLGKNVLKKIPRAKKFVYIGSGILLVLLDLYVLFFHGGALKKRLVVCAGSVLIMALPFLLKRLRSVCAALFSPLLQNSRARTRQFFLATLTLFVLVGIFIPAVLIASSPQEFSFLESYTSPLPFIGNTVLQSAGIFLFWATCVYFIFSPRVQTAITVILSCTALVAICNCFVFSGNYGTISIMLTFADSSRLIPSFIKSLLSVLCAVSICILTVLLSRKKKIPGAIFAVAFIALGVIGIERIHYINQEYTALASRTKDTSGGKAAEQKIEPIYEFSTEGKNILVIMLDRAISGYVPYIFDEKPELCRFFDGFTWYKNCISFGAHTVFGAPGLFGGYEYTPGEMQKREKETMRAKHNEALLLLPRIFSDADYHVTVAEPPFADYSWVSDMSIYKAYPKIETDNIVGKYSPEWLKKNNLKLVENSKLLESNLLSFSFLRIAPPVLRNFIYDHGNWLNIHKFLELVSGLADNYIALDILPELSLITDSDVNTCNIFDNNLTHLPSFLQAPEYTLSNTVTHRGAGYFASSEHYHVNIAAFILLGKWFDYLKAHGVYDNTRIIIVSDHGADPFGRITDKYFPDTLRLPNREYLVSYTALLMVKDFNTQGNLHVDNTFMTNADVPFLATDGLIAAPANPFTGAAVSTQKDAGATITTSHLYSPGNHPGNTFDIKPDEWLHVHDDIYQPENWSRVRNE